MAIDFAAADRHAPMLLLQPFGLGGQASGDRLDLLGLLLDLGLTAIELHLAGLQDLAHLADLPLPLDELMTKCGHGQAMFVPGGVQAELLLTDAGRFGGDFLACGLELIAALAGVGVDLGQMLPQLLAGPQQPFHADTGAVLEFGELLGQLDCVRAPGRLEGFLGAQGGFFAGQSASPGLEGDAAIGELLAGGSQEFGQSSSRRATSDFRWVSGDACEQKLGGRLVRDLRRSGSPGSGARLRADGCLRAMFLFQSLGASLKECCLIR